MKTKVEALTIRISCLADDVGPVSSLKKKQDRHFMQIMQGVYTDHITADMPPDSICSVSGTYVLTGVQELKDGDAAEEEMHRREAAQGMLHLQDPTATVTKSESIVINYFVCKQECFF